MPRILSQHQEVMLSRRAWRADSASTMTASAKKFAVNVLQQSHILSKLPADKLDLMASRMRVQQCAAGEILVHIGTRAQNVILLQHGECIAAKAPVNAKTTIQDLRNVGHMFMVRGDFYGELMLIKRQCNPASIVAVRQNTVVIVLSLDVLMSTVGAATEADMTTALLTLAATPDGISLSKNSVPFRELTFHRVVGRGQFGAVRMATHRATGRTFALKTLYKQPISDTKQVEHVVNELTVMQSLDSTFCTQARAPQSLCFPAVRRVCLWRPQDTGWYPVAWQYRVGILLKH